MYWVGVLFSLEIVLNDSNPKAKFERKDRFTILHYTRPTRLDDAINDGIFSLWVQ